MVYTMLKTYFKCLKVEKNYYMLLNKNMIWQGYVNE